MFALRRKYLADSRLSGRLAWAATAVLAAFAAYLILSVGIYLVPVVILLACAARLTPGACEIREARTPSPRGSPGSPAAPAHG
jgi:hypothetical protein